ncbi:MAG: primosomal protein N' [Acidobacteria bacterium]|nr:MAG: primosomal protein N' [Acidobacteriota bacterium]
MYADIAVCLPLARTFIYKLTTPVETGCRVVVPFRKRDVEGFVVGFRKDAPPDIEVHEIGSVLDAIPLLRPDVFNLCRWVADYYATPIGEVLKAALPPGISAKHVEGLQHSPPRREGVDAPSKAKAQTGWREARVRQGEASIEDRQDISAELTTPARQLLLSCRATPPLRGGELVMTPDQTKALSTINSTPGFRPILLHGVTGSGKTEIYMQAVEHFLAAGKTSLILVPEIGLTPQLTDQFARRFPNQIAILHSSLTRRQRIDEWLRIYRGEVPIVIGTRSAVFAPLGNLALIVVDEEHETSYKQEEVPRYHARDTAVMRAKLAGAAVVLGSATPSMESFHNAASQKYDYVMLTTRVEGRPLPAVEIVNMREEYAAEGKQVVLSRRLLEAINARLDRGEQTMILLNRRGYATFLLCRHCGFTFQCNSCSVAMTYHRSIEKLLCHYCGLARRPPARCPECDSEYIHYVGEGTERLEAELKCRFPEARVGRIDRDAMRHMRDYERVLGGFRAGDIDILAGTQMIAKGHDFPRVTLVGVVGADAPLALPDFRAAERTFQLLTQVAGRSGRGGRPGEVVIQSYFPDHYTFQLAVTQRFEDFYARESRYRKAMFYPPFTALAGIMVTDRDRGRAADTAREIGEYLDSLRSNAMRILGPAPAPLERIKRMHRQQLLIKSSSRASLHQLLGRLRQYIEDRKFGSTRVFIDVDPVSLL